MAALNGATPAANAEAPGTGGTRTSLLGEGTVTGHMLRTARKAAGLNREQLAERLGVDVETIKSWEIGKRPLVKVPVRTLRRILAQLEQAGTPPAITRALEPAMDADELLEQVMSGADPKEWLLGHLVNWRELSDLILWPLTGNVPASILAVVDDPPHIRKAQPGERDEFFDTLREGVDSPRVSPLLRRQAIYVVGQDDRPDTGRWVADAERSALVRSDADWLSTWVTRRSIAVARACQGDPELLRDFIASDLADDDAAEDLNFVYWCYWASPAGRARSDNVMASTPTAQLPVGRLLDHLVLQLHGSNPYVDLSAYSVASLIRRWPRLLLENRALARSLSERAVVLLDGAVDHDPTRQALDRIRYAASMAEESSK